MSLIYLIFSLTFHKHKIPNLQMEPKDLLELQLRSSPLKTMAALEEGLYDIVSAEFLLLTKLHNSWLWLPPIFKGFLNLGWQPFFFFNI